MWEIEFIKILLFKKNKNTPFLKQLSHSFVDIQIVNKHIPQNFIREMVVKFYQTNKY